MQLPHILQLKSAPFTQRSKVVNARMGTESRCTGMNGDWDLRGEKTDIFVSWLLIAVLFIEEKWYLVEEYKQVHHTAK